MCSLFSTPLFFARALAISFSLADDRIERVTEPATLLLSLVVVYYKVICVYIPAARRLRTPHTRRYESLSTIVLHIIISASDILFDTLTAARLARSRINYRRRAADNRRAITSPTYRMRSRNRNTRAFFFANAFRSP